MNKASLSASVAAPTPTFRFKYPFNEMTEVNDSFFVEFSGDKERDDKLKVSIRAAAHQYGHRHGMKFITRVVTDEATSKKGLRVWRLL